MKIWDSVYISWITVTVIKLLLTAIRDVRITSRRSWYCQFRGHLIITPSLGMKHASKTKCKNATGRGVWDQQTWYVMRGERSRNVKIYQNIFLCFSFLMEETMTLQFWDLSIQFLKEPMSVQRTLICASMMAISKMKMMSMLLWLVVPWQTLSR